MKQSLVASLAFPWLLLVIVVLLPLAAWLQLLHWELSSITLWTVFPLLGVWAWSIMWTHYVFGAVRIKNPAIKKQPMYSQITNSAVLALIILHPLLLAHNMLQVTGQRPPESFFSYVGQSNEYVILLGYIGLSLFLAFEVLDRLRRRAWVQKQWKWISASQVVAMVLIFIHGISIGQIISTTWYGLVWAILGITLVPGMWVVLRHDWHAPEKADG